MTDMSQYTDEELEAVANASSYSDQELEAIASQSASVGTDAVSVYSDEELEAIAQAGESTSTDYITETEIADISSRYSDAVTPELLKQWVPKYAGEMAATAGELGKEDIGQELGRVGEAVFLGLPQWIEKKISLDEDQQKAVDELRKLVESKKSVGEHIGELALGLATPVPGATAVKAGLKGVASTGIALGAIYGLAHSDSGEELEGTLVGGGFGALGGAAIYGAGKTIGKGVELGKRALGKRIAKRISMNIADDGIGLEQTIARDMEKASEGEWALSSAVFDQATQRRVRASDGSSRKLSGWSKIIGGDEVVTALNRDIRSSYIADKRARITDPVGKKVYRDEAMIKRLADKRGTDLPIDQYISREIVREETIGFANYVNRRQMVSEKGLSSRRTNAGRIRDIGSAQNVINDYSKITNDPEFMAREFANYRSARRASELVAERMGKEIIGENFTGRMGRAILDAKYVYRGIDEIHGTELEPLIGKMSNDYHMFTQDVAHWDVGLRAIQKEAKRVGLTPEKMTEILDGPIGEVQQRIARESAEVQDVLKAFNNFNKDTLDTANMLASAQGHAGDWITDIGESKGMNYVHHSLKDYTESLAALRAHERKLGIGDLAGDGVEEVIARGSMQRNSPEGEYLRALNILSGGDVSVLSVNKIIGIRVGLENKENSVARVISTAAAARARTGEIPSFLRENDIFKSTKKGIYGTFRYLHMRDSIGKLKSAEHTMREGGDLMSAGYIADHLDDLMGSSRSSPANWAKNKILGWKLSTDKAAEVAASEGKKVKAAAIRVSGMVPDMIKAGSANMYPYYLGARVDAPLRNLTQPFTLTANEINSPAHRNYGTKAILKAQADTFAARVKGVSNFKQKLTEEGYIPGAFTAEGEQLLEKAIREGAGTNKALASSAETIEGIKRFSMKWYEASDTRNRIVTYSAAKYVANDLVGAIAAKRSGALTTKDQAGALSFMNNLPAAYRRRILRADSTEAVHREVAEYLLSTTQFNYNKVSMSDYGRFMGGMFSMFTKWPTSIAGDLHDTFTRRGLDRSMQKGFQRYILPVIGFYGIEEMLFDGTGQDQSKLKQKILGRNLTSWAPVGTVPAIIGGIGQAPVIDAASGVISTILSGNPEKAVEKASRAASSMIGPGIAIRFLTKDLEEWIEALDE